MKPILIILFLSFNFAGLLINCRPDTDEITPAETKSDVYASAISTITPPDDEAAKLNKAGNKSNIISCQDEELSPIWKVLTDDKDIKRWLSKAI